MFLFKIVVFFSTKSSLLFIVIGAIGAQGGRVIDHLASSSNTTSHIKHHKQYVGSEAHPGGAVGFSLKMELHGVTLTLSEMLRDRVVLIKSGVCPSLHASY
jgi:hypothetical protein